MPANRIGRRLVGRLATGSGASAMAGSGKRVSAIGAGATAILGTTGATAGAAGVWTLGSGGGLEAANRNGDAGGGGGADAGACAACRSRSAFFRASLMRLMAGGCRAYRISRAN